MAGEQGFHTIDKFTYNGETYLLQDNTSGYIKNAGVTSFNGSTGAVTYTAPVTSVNGQTGAVTISTGSNYTAGDGINITNNEISVASNLTVSGHTAYISYVAGSGINSASGVSF